MKVVLLAGGLGTRLAEETELKPKPMVEIGGFPILVHIMKIYAHYGFRDFLVALGYRGDVIKEYFLKYHLRHRDISVNLATGQANFRDTNHDDWDVRLVETGDKTMTGGRLLRLASILSPEGTFMLTYGDGVANVNLEQLVSFHRSHGKIGTVTGVRPPARFGALQIDGNQVVNFSEKPQTEGGWINGGFFVFEPQFFDYLHGDDTILEREPLEELAKDGELMCFKHPGFWHAMDTVRDREVLTEYWRTDSAPWNVWRRNVP